MRPVELTSSLLRGSISPSAPAAQGLRPAGAAAWQVAVLVERRVETAHSCTLTFETKSSSFEHLAGQYVKLKVPVVGFEKALRRNYSIASAPRPNSSTFEITVSRADPGIVSPVLVDEIAIGTELEFRGPVGTFVWPQKKLDTGLLIAGGSGIVPVMSMIRHIDTLPVQPAVTLLYSCRTKGDVIYRDELVGADRPWLKTFFTFTRDLEGGGQYCRRIDAGMLQEIMPGEADVAFICGPPAMVMGTKEELLSRGVDESKISVEVFD